MPSSHKSSPTYVVILKKSDGKLDLVFLNSKSTKTPDSYVHEVERHFLEGKFPVSERDALIRSFNLASVPVRYFDEEEKQWMEVHPALGVDRVPGPRDGQWGPPDLKTFYREYLRMEL